MKRPERLSAGFVKAINKPGRYGDGRGANGLSLLVKPSKHGFSKTWAQRLPVAGRSKSIGLGSYPIISLTEARQKAFTNSIAVKQVYRRKSALELILEQAVLSGGSGLSFGTPTDAPVHTAPIPTFRVVAEEFMASRQDGWKTGGKTENLIRSRLTTYAFPVIGDIPVNRVTSSHVVDILTPIWYKKQAVGKKVKQYISQMCRYSMGKGWRTDDPTETAMNAFTKQKHGKHLRALAYKDISDALATVESADASLSTRLCLRWVVLTGARSGEARGTTWGELDMGAKTWTLPADRMKADREHRVPLSDAALDVLGQARALDDGSGLVFPSPTKQGVPLSDMTLTKLLRSTGLADRATVHGFRSTFRDWAAEQTDCPREIAEHALAHVEGSGAELAYRRTDYFDRRRVLMGAWADYVTQ